jgi:SIR2-like domain
MVASKASAMRTSSPGRLRSLLMDSTEPVLLLGAGASITSGIPAAGQTVEKVARWAWCKENGRHPDDFTIRRSDYWPWLTAQPWYKPDLSPADLYPDAIDNLLGVKKDRREFFEKLINPPGVPPSRGYIALTQILHQGWISTVLTTNFDQCLERAAIQQNRPHRLISISTPADYVMFNSAPHDPQLVFLHGSVKHYTDKNLTDEVQSLDPLLVERLRPLFRDHPVITVGYRGAEGSVMNDLFLTQARSSGFLHGVYWCVLENDLGGPHSPFVEQLAGAIGSNFQLVPIRGFDDLFEKDLLASMIAAGARPTRRPTRRHAPTRRSRHLRLRTAVAASPLASVCRPDRSLAAGGRRRRLGRGDDRPARPSAAGERDRRSDARRVAAVFAQPFCRISSGPG